MNSLADKKSTCVWYIMTGLLFFFSCSDKEELSNCVISEAIISYDNHNELVGRYEFDHDGSHYTEMRYYHKRNEGEGFRSDPESSTKFSYNNDRVSQIIEVYYAANFYRTSDYTYDLGEITRVTVHERTFRDGQQTDERTLEFDLFENPGNNSYITKNGLGEDILVVFEDGNLVRLGTESSTGNYQALDKSWLIFVEYKYDNNPNVMQDVIFQDIIGPLNWGYLKNNMISEEYPAGYEINHTFKFFSKVLIKEHVLESTGRTFTFEYNCD